MDIQKAKQRTIDGLQNITDFGDNITRIVITGGPCSGKTTGLSVLSSKLSDRGYKVIISPESATKLINAGIVPGKDELSGRQFQEEILLDTIEQENRILSAARRYRDKGRKVVILCDRGTMDGQAYVDQEEFEEMLDSFGHSPRTLCDERYHAVMHMRTAAIGAEAFYTLENNKARKETPEEARALDHRTYEAWQRHPHPRVIDNSTDFEGKVRRLFAEVCVVLGDPIPLEKERKYLVDTACAVSIQAKAHEVLIIQDYLVPSDPREEQRVRVRQSGDGASYYFTRKRYVAPGNRVEIERMITRDEYTQLLTRRDHHLETVIKRRVCFLWMERHFEVDFFEAPSNHKGLVLMEVEHSEDDPTIELPPFVPIVRDVTDEKGFSNAELAKNKALKV